MQNPSEPGQPPYREAARVTPIDRSLVDRLLGGARNLFSPERPPAVQPAGSDKKEPWFGPGRPQVPTAPREDVAGRAFDFPVGINTYARPRAHEGVSFEQLRALADNYDLLRICIETRKDHMANLEWAIQPRKPPGQSHRPKPSPRCQEVQRFFRKPDRHHSWQDWVRILVEEQIVLDAPAIYKRTTVEGKPWAAEIISGDTIQPLIDATGRRPMAPDPAYQQVLKGGVAASYTNDELLYVPRNPRANKLYGLGVVEQVIATVNIGLRREVAQLHHFTEGNVPDALIGVPETWTPIQINEFQRYWDALMASEETKRKAKFVPGGLNYLPTRNDAALVDQFDEWLARIICYAMSLPPLPFVKTFNRATAQTSYDTAMEEGLAPMMAWLKNAIDDLIADWFGEPDLELVWDNIRKLDPTEQNRENLQLMQRGVRSLDEIRADMGDEPLGLGHIMFGVGPLGFMSIADMKRCIEQGLTMPQNPMMPPEMGGMPMGPGGMPQGGEAGMIDMLQGVDPALLHTVGLSPEGSLLEPADDDDEDLTAEEALPGSVHPEVSRTLNEVESRLGFTDARAP